MLFKEQKLKKKKKKGTFPSFHLIPFGVIRISWTLLWAMYKATLNRTTMRDLVLRGPIVIAVVHEIQVCYEMQSVLQVYSHLMIVQVRLRFPLKGSVF